MKRCILAVISAVFAVAGIAEAQTRRHTDIARAAAYRPGQDFTWIFDRLCFEPTPEPSPCAGEKGSANQPRITRITQMNRHLRNPRLLRQWLIA